MPGLANGTDTYLLTRDAEETERLNEQHNLFTENLGYVVNPLVYSNFGHGTRVADVATGSGAWALEAASILPPGSKVDGFDISSDQFPIKHPESVSFNVHDAKTSFPSHLHGTYDMIHVRALVAAMDRSDWAQVTANLTELLKPGGYLQWTEADLSKLVCMRSGPSPGFFAAIPRLLCLFNKHAHLRTLYGAAELPEAFRSAGLHPVQTDVISSDRVPSTRSTMTASYLVAMLGWARASGQMTEQELGHLRIQITEEVKRGAYIRGDSYTTIGIKP